MHLKIGVKRTSVLRSLNWRKIHRYSGITLSIFFLFHTVNHLFAWGGANAHIKVMNLFRIVYRFPPVEAVILLSALIQLASGPVLVWKKSVKKNVYSILQICSGLYLSFFLFYHIRAVMLGRHVWQVETDFHFAAWGVKNSPADRFFIPYYSMSILCVFIHIACIHREKLLNNVSPNTSSNIQRASQIQAITIMLFGAIVTTGIIVSFIRG
jgi:hypothetical protein